MRDHQISGDAGIANSGIPMFTRVLVVFGKGLRVSFSLRTKVRQDISGFKVYLRM